MERQRALLSIRALGHLVTKLFTPTESKEESPVDVIKRALGPMAGAQNPWDAMLPEDSNEL